MLPGILQLWLNFQKKHSTSDFITPQKNLNMERMFYPRQECWLRNSFAAPNRNSRCCHGERLSHTPIAQPPVDHPASRSQLPGKSSNRRVSTSIRSIPAPAPLPVVESIGSSSMARTHPNAINKRSRGLVPWSPQFTHTQDSKLKYPNLLRMDRFSRKPVQELRSSEAIQIMLRCFSLGAAWHVYESLERISWKHGSGAFFVSQESSLSAASSHAPTCGELESSSWNDLGWILFDELRHCRSLLKFLNWTWMIFV